MDLLKAFEQVQWIKSPTNILSHWDTSKVRYGFDTKKPENPFCVHQVHGNAIVAADSVQGAEPQADGIFTQKKHKTIAIKTADCVPILFHAPGFVMAIHAGWRGIAKGIVSEAAKVMKTQTIDLREVNVGIGPHIGPLRYEVGDDVIEGMRKSPFPNLDYCLVKTGPGKWHIDLGAKCVGELVELGFPAKNVTCSRSCTHTEAEIWPSYRRDGSHAGRIWSWVVLAQ